MTAVPSLRSFFASAGCLQVLNDDYVEAGTRGWQAGNGRSSTGVNSFDGCAADRGIATRGAKKGYFLHIYIQALL